MVSGWVALINPPTHFCIRTVYVCRWATQNLSQIKLSFWGISHLTSTPPLNTCSKKKKTEIVANHSPNSKLNFWRKFPENISILVVLAYKNKICMTGMSRNVSCTNHNLIEPLTRNAFNSTCTSMYINFLQFHNFLLTNLYTLWFSLTFRHKTWAYPCSQIYCRQSVVGLHLV